MRRIGQRVAQHVEPFDALRKFLNRNRAGHVDDLRRPVPKRPGHVDIGAGKIEQNRLAGA